VIKNGKTRVITEKIKFLLKTDLKSSEILYFIFSEKTINDLKERIQEAKNILKGYVATIQAKKFGTTSDMFTCNSYEYSNIYEEAD